MRRACCRVVAHHCDERLRASGCADDGPRELKRVVIDGVTEASSENVLARETRVEKRG